MFTKFGSALLALLAAGALIAGCGSSSSSTSTAGTTATDTTATDTSADTTATTTTSSSPLSTSAYTAKLTDVFCPLGTDLQTLGAQAQAAQSLDDLDKALTTAEGKFEDAISNLQSLTPPADVQQAHQNLIDTLNTFKSVTAATEQAIAGGNHSDIRAKVLVFQQAAQTFKSDLDQEKKDFASQGVVFNGC